MKNKAKIITINIFVVFLAILTLIAGVFSVFMKIFAKKDKAITEISVAADNKITFKKTGLLDLVGGGSEIKVSNPITISSKEDAINLYNNYIDNYFNTGKVKAISSTVVSGGGSLGALSAVYVGIYNEEMYYNKDGTFISDGVYCKIPNIKGDDDGPYAPDNFIEHIEIKDKHKIKYGISGGKNVCNYTVNNGEYVINKYVSDLPFDYEEDISGTTYLTPFFVTDETVADYSVDASSGFVIKVKYTIKDSALLEYKKGIKSADSNNTGLPTFIKMNFEVTFNKYTGDIIQISKYEEYTLPNAITVDIQRNTEIYFKKED